MKYFLSDIYIVLLGKGIFFRQRDYFSKCRRVN